MKSAALILRKVIVHQFYGSNAALFFLVLAFAGGFMRSVDHIALGELCVSSPFMTLIPTMVWILYAAFILDFNKVLISKPENHFLINFNLIPILRQWLLLFRISSLQFAPAILYGFFLIGLALKNGFQMPALLISVSCVSILLGLTVLLKKSLQHVQGENKKSLLSRIVHRRVNKHFTIILIEGTVRRQVLAIVGYKIASIVILWAGLFLYGTDDYDLRLLGLVITISFFMHISFVAEWHRFENYSFTLYRRMPFSKHQRLIYALLIIIIATIPEGILLMKNFPTRFGSNDLAINYVYGLSICFVCYSFLYTKDRMMEQLISYVSIVAIAYFLCILSGVTVTFLSVLNIIAGISIFWFYYDRFEYTSGDSGNHKSISRP